MNYLIVDDHAGYCALISRLIAQPGDQVRECPSAEAALETLSSFNPDLVTVDLALPGMNGFAAICAIRRECPTARIVMVSSFDDAACRIVAESLGAEAFVGKGDLVRLRNLVAGGPTAVSFTRQDEPQSAA